MAYATITEKVVGSTNTSERKILADDVNQIRQVIQTGEKDLKTKNISLLGNTITADNGSNWIRRNNNTFQFYNGSSWQEPSTATLLTFTAGENIAARDVVYLKVSDGKIYKASTTNSDWIGVATAAITSGASGTIYPNGSLVGGFSGLTSGTWYGLNATAGTLTANENYIVGLAISATQIILIKPKKDMSTRDNALYKLQGEKAINDVSATNSGVLAGSSQVLIDKFLDSTGQNNTVDTGNTTAQYYPFSDYYNCTTDTPSDTQTLTTSDDDWASVVSFTVTAKKKMIVTTIAYYKSDGGSSTIYYTISQGGNTLVSKSKSVGSAGYYTQTFSMLDYTTPIEIGDFTITVAGGSYNRIRKSYSVDNSLLTISSQSVCAPDTTNTFLIAESVEDYVDSTIQSVATTIPSGKTKVFVTPLMYEALATGDSITADVSIDNGAHYTTGIPINTWTPITSTNGTSLIVKANLLTGDGSTTPKVSGWRVLLE